LSLDQSDLGYQTQLSVAAGEPPRKRLRDMKSRLQARSSTALKDIHSVRFPGHLMLMHSFRLQLASIQRSWKSVRSGILCWAEFMREFFPLSAHFPVREFHLRLFMSLFRYGSTCAQYISHLRFASRVLSLPFLISNDIVASLTRGLQKMSGKRQASVIRPSILRSLVYQLVDLGRLDLARFVIVAFHFMLRVPSELLPLQMDGRGPSHWHSFISNKHRRIILHFHRRKNSSSGASVKRSCICPDDRHTTLCGVCAMRAQMESHGPDLSIPLFHSIHLQDDIQLLRRLLSSHDIAQVSWHSFRRSAAHDLLNKGSSIGHIIRAGGWKSGAFLTYLSKREVDNRAHLDLIHDVSDSDRED